jgi:hypothetical protein
MTQLNNGPISSNDLMQRLAQAKKVMNKVDGGNFERGHVNESMLLSDPEEYIQNSNAPALSATRNVSAPASVDKIKNSRLPDNIKQAMIENPIQQMPQISLSETLDMDFVKGAKRLMEQEGTSSKKPQPQQKQSLATNTGGNMDMNAIAVLIENTVRKVMDEKLNQILTASTTASINENLVLKVGDSIFKGKITGVNKSK